MQQSLTTVLRIPQALSVVPSLRSGPYDQGPSGTLNTVVTSEAAPNYYVIFEPLNSSLSSCEEDTSKESENSKNYLCSSELCSRLLALYLLGSMATRKASGISYGYTNNIRTIFTINVILLPWLQWLLNLTTRDNRLYQIQAEDQTTRDEWRAVIEDCIRKLDPSKIDRHVSPTRTLTRTDTFHSTNSNLR